METPIGLFIYYHVPIEIFHIGVSFNKTNDSGVLIADPWKALADYIFIKKRSWKNIFSLSSDLRIELDALQSSDISLLLKLSETYPNHRTKKQLEILHKDLNQ